MKSLLFLCAWCALGDAGQGKPPRPTPGPDMRLTGGQTLEKFFAARRNNKPCRTNLQNAYDKYNKRKADLSTATNLFRAQCPKPDATSDCKKSATELETIQKEVETLRGPVLVHAEECGDCATNQVINVEGTAHDGSPQNWFLSDASCYLPESTAADYAHRAKSLLNVPSYPQKDGGFRDILLFQLHDGEEWLKTPTIVADALAYVAVKSPLKLGVLKYALSYYFVNHTEGFDPKADSFVISFESTDKPTDLSDPNPFEVRANGTKIPYNNRPLNEVAGFWWVTQNSLRYYTEADFGSITGTGSRFLDDIADTTRKKFTFIEKEARQVLLDTMLQMAERTAPGTPVHMARDRAASTEAGGR